jgi:hypothetical protein
MSRFIITVLLFTVLVPVAIFCREVMSLRGNPNKRDVIIWIAIGFVMGVAYALNDHFGWIEPWRGRSLRRQPSL